MNKRLKIGYDAKRLFHNHTGLGNYSRTLLRNLQQMYPQHEYHLFTPKLSNHPEVLYFLEDNRFIVHDYQGHFGSLWRSYGIKKNIDALGLDLFHGLSHEIPFGEMKTRTVVSFHDLIYEYYPKQFGLWDRKSYQKKYRYAAQNTNHVVAISESTKRDLIKLYELDEERISVVYQSCNPLFKTMPRSTKEQEAYFLYVGSLIERKSAKLIVEAYRLMPENKRIKVKIVGKGGQYADELHALVKNYGLGGHFEFLNHIDNSKLISLYDNALAMVYPSIYEGFGIPLIESLYRNTPVITTNASSLPEAAGPGAIYIEPHNAEQLADAMQLLISNKEEHNSLAQKGHQYVNDMFSIQRTAEEMMAVYHKIIQDS